MKELSVPRVGTVGYFCSASLELYSALQQNTLSINMGSKNLDEVEELIRAVKNYLKKIFPLIFS
ncbi:hypothetical protein QO021_16155 [Pseudomonas amygdali pv. lachrymans]|uniref:hypothetical protein n=1 Tax=Pseudomonas amygdali TaxID=47877 RepID=UPI001F2887BC|nr:hypothetical protein [Pseudomonas amygdali]WIO56118.1 hypothetical protein QO021_16155 [Pseudomonas amygdali pv. lachrymans]